MEDLTENHARRTEELRSLMLFIGSTLTTWNRVEEELYKFFEKLVGIKSKDLSSVIFFGAPTFSSRRTLVDRVAHFALVEEKYSEQRKEWGKLSSLFEHNLAPKRNAVAHYSLDHNITIVSTDPPKFSLGEPRLSPSGHDKILSDFKKKTPEKDAVTVKKMAGYIQEFQDAELRLVALTKSIPRGPAPTTTSFLARLLLDSGWTPKDDQSPRPSGPDVMPSGPEPRP